MGTKARRSFVLPELDAPHRQFGAEQLTLLEALDTRIGYSLHVIVLLLIIPWMMYQVWVFSLVAAGEEIARMEQSSAWFSSAPERPSSAERLADATANCFVERFQLFAFLVHHLQDLRVLQVERSTIR